MMGERGKLFRLLALVAVTVASVLVAVAPGSAATSFQRGDLFAAGGIGIYDGHVQWLRPNGTPVATLDSGLQMIGGMAFDQTGRLAITGFLDNKVVRFASDGSFLGTFIAQINPFPGCDQPTDLSYDRAGNLIVGDFGSCNGATKWDADGRPLGVVVGGESDAVDLDSDQCSLFVADANDQSTFVRNICTGETVPGPNYSQLSPGEPQGVRILPDGSVLNTDSNAIRHYTRAGKLLRGYGESICSGWAGVVPDVGGKSFWSYCAFTDTNTLFDVKSGSVLRTVSGLGRVFAVNGGFRAALVCPAPRRCGA